MKNIILIITIIFIFTSCSNANIIEDTKSKLGLSSTGSSNELGKQNQEEDNNKLPNDINEKILKNKVKQEKIDQIEPINIKLQDNIINTANITEKKESTNNIFGDISKYSEIGELNFSLHAELNGYIDKVEIEWINNGKKKDLFLINKENQKVKYVGEEGYRYTGFRYHLRGGENIDLGLNIYNFKAFLNGKLVGKKKFFHKAKKCGKNISSLNDLYSNIDKLKIMSFTFIKGVYYSVISKSIGANQVELTLEKISCDILGKEVLYTKKGPGWISSGSDEDYNSIHIKGEYNNKLLFYTNEELGEYVFYSNYLYDLGIGKLIKLENDGNAVNIQEGTKGIYILYVGGIGKNDKLILITKDNKEIVLFEDRASLEEFGNSILSNDFLNIYNYELLINKQVKLFLKKGNGTETLEKIEKIIDIN